MIYHKQEPTVGFVVNDSEVEKLVESGYSLLPLAKVIKTRQGVLKAPVQAPNKAEALVNSISVDELREFAESHEIKLGRLKDESKIRALLIKELS